MKSTIIRSRKMMVPARSLQVNWLPCYMLQRSLWSITRWTCTCRGKKNISLLCVQCIDCCYGVYTNCYQNVSTLLWLGRTNQDNFDNFICFDFLRRSSMICSFPHLIVKISLDLTLSLMFTTGTKGLCSTRIPANSSSSWIMWLITTRGILSMWRLINRSRKGRDLSPYVRKGNSHRWECYHLSCNICWTFFFNLLSQ